MKLSNAAKKIKKDIIEGYSIQDPGGLNILEVAMECYDRMKEAQKQVNTDGILIKDRFGTPVPHPMLKVEKEARAQLLQAFKLMNLDYTYK